MELLSPAGSTEKLYYAYTYGADAAYIGLKHFSLRVHAENFYENEYKAVQKLKKDFATKKLYCTLNICFHNKDIKDFIDSIEYFSLYPIDAFIIQDLGLVTILQKHFPNVALHLSTQASCVNAESVKMYRSMGFKRIVLGREASLIEIREIKDKVPDMELEAFCHGAMCIAYSGRCLMSAYLTGRSAQSGDCSHSCRWDYDVLCQGAKKLAQSGILALKEHSREGEYFPIYEGDSFTAILSSKDLCMINHLDDMKNAGIDAIKIEGRMKSIYYVAMTTLAYRKALDLQEGNISEKEAMPFILELNNVSHRKLSTGFFYGKDEANKTTSGETSSNYMLVAKVVRKLEFLQQEAIFNLALDYKKQQEAEFSAMHPKEKAARLLDMKNNPTRYPKVIEKKNDFSLYEIKALNMIKKEDTLELIMPSSVITKLLPCDYYMINPENGTIRDWVCDSHDCLLYVKNLELSLATLIRKSSFN